MSRILTTTQPNKEAFELRTNNAGPIITTVEEVTPQFVTDAYLASWAVTDWYLDGLIGDDTNDGTTAATPLKTGAELARRLGPSAQWDHNVTINVGVNGISDALNITGNTTQAGIHVDILGSVPDDIATPAGAITAITPMDHATPRSPTIKCANITDFSYYIRKRIRVISGAHIGAITWILKANPNSLGIDVARTGVFYKILKGPSDTTIISRVTPSVGDEVVIESVPVIGSLNLKIGGTVNTGVYALCPWNYRQYSVQNLDWQSGSRDCTSDYLLYRNVIFGCKMSQFISVAGSYATSTNFAPMTSCLVFGDPTYFGQVSANGVWAGCCFLQSPGTQMSVTNNYTQPGRFYYCVGQGCNFTSASPDRFSNVQSFDNLVNYSAFGVAGTGVWLQNVSSADNAGQGLGLYNMTQTLINGSINITGAVANVVLSNPSPVNLPLTVTVNSLIPMVDFGWSGTATLVAGTVTVTVPYVNWTEQQITFSRANPIGTVGDLSVPTATRTTTSFVINSSNVADLSTVNWQISPLKRSISITK